MEKIIRILAVTAIIVFSIQSFSNNKADVDLWGNVGFVKALPWSQEFYRTNTFSFTEPDHPWINHEWLAEYIFNKVYSIAGNPGLLLLKVFLGLLIVALLNLSIKNQCKSGLLRFLFLFLVISTIGYGFSTRPHLFTYLILVLFLLILRYLNKNNLLALLVLPVLGLVWTNLHGAFVIGIILMIIFTCFESFKLLANGKIKNEYRYVAGLILTSFLLVAVSFVNPYGFDLWKFIFDSATTARPYLSEWAPFNLIANFTDHTDFIALSLVSISAIFFSGKQQNATWICILFVTFLGALLLRRNIPIFAIIACFVIPEHLENIVGESLEKIQNKIPQRLPLFVLCFLIPLSTWFTVAANKINPLQIEVPHDRFPTGIMSFIKENHIKGNILVFFDWAEYCIWKLYPDCRVFLDGRFTDAYSHETVNDYFTFLYSGKKWENTLNKYPIDILLLHKGNSTYNMFLINKNSPLYKKTPCLEQWTLVCEDRIAGLFLKTNIHSNTITTLNLQQPIMTNNNTVTFFP